MNKITSKSNGECVGKLFTTFDIQDKCVELELIVMRRRYQLFQGASVVIAVPTLDESQRYIKTDDFSLFQQQKEDANVLARYLTQNNANIIGVIKDINLDLDDQLNGFENKDIDYLIFLHEFTTAE